MSKKVLSRTAVAFCLMLVPIGVAMAPGAAAIEANEAAEVCRALDEAGDLDGAINITRGECVNLLKGPASANANNFIAALCGTDTAQQLFQTKNKGQCIKVLRSSFPNP